MFGVPRAGWFLSPVWGMRWVTIYVGMIVASVAVGLSLFGTRYASMFGPEWQGTSAAWHQAAQGADRLFLLSADEAPHVDRETGLPVGRWADFGGANERDRAFAAGWNRQVRERLAEKPAPRRFDDRVTDGASILREFERRSGDVAAVPEFRETPGGMWETAFAVQSAAVTLRLPQWECMVPPSLRVGGRDVPFPGSAYVLSVGQMPDKRAGRDRQGAWIPRCASYRALLSEDARTLWLVGSDGDRGSGARPETWTAAIDVATGFTLGVDVVEPR